ncbi:outer membrane biogenesis protein BamB [Novipirellula galeiformis]|uniref:Outer membrane biogenesis protein BamB n=1 Tax=Novipirellula galeiformis TaxID=2528004 RepID=A0A5C6CG69_9BACT|nr:PQQ-binding-like beta-propeller repeat protein [Novipirellula galeiformis]TWU23298.1 outer membrane biogenesis protein BamB [Novipirellula galeiformis]
MFYVLAIWIGLTTSVPDAWPAFLGAGAGPRDATALPLTWSPTEHIAWIKSVPGHGQSSPVVWGNRVFVTSVEGAQKDTYYTVCLDTADGSELWRNELTNSAPVTNSHYVSRAAPTPVVDEHRVIAVFESGDCVAYDHAGKTQWTRTLVKEEGPFVAEFGLGASPCQTESTVFVLLEHDGPSSLLALDKQTGKTLWKAPRDPRRSWSSPAVIEVEGAPQIVVSSAGTVDGYDPGTGTLLWSFKDVGGNTSTTPMNIGGGRFLIGASPGRNGENAGSAADSNGLMQITREGGTWTATRQWTATKATPTWASPIVHQGLAYWINRSGVIHCFDATTGEALFTERSKQSSWATPYGVGNRVYFFGKDGLVTVLSAGREFNVLAENATWDEGTLPPETKLAEESSEQRRRAAAMFSKPTLYGVAVTEDAFLLRVGNAVICVR